MARLTAGPFRVGDWSVRPASGEMSRNGETIRLELRTMRLLACLADRPGEVLSIDDLLKQVWPEVTVTPDSVYQAVASLRRVLGDDPKQPIYIATVPRLGYRMVAPVQPASSGAARQSEATRSSGEDGAPTPKEDGAPTPNLDASSETHRRVRARVIWAAVAGLCSLVVAAALITGTSRMTARRSSTPPPQQSIAVLPFVDLTEHMKEEEFADGVTEELIDRLNRVPGLRVPPPTASFYFKNKRQSIPEVAKALDVAYVLDGSTRKSGDRLRVAARLIRADKGVVVWSESYDRPWGDVLTVQDDIAGEVTKALTASIAARP